MRKIIRILYLEDLPEDAELLRELLAREYFACELTWVNHREAYEAALRDGWNYDLLLVDYSLPDIGGEEALELAKALAPELPFIFLAGSLGEEKAVELLRQGATDYVLKTNLPRLAPVVHRALEEATQATARREAERSHARVASLLRAVLESTPEGILVVDLAGRISSYNRKFLSLCGIPEFVMAPMAMDEVIQFLTTQFGDPGALLEEARLLQDRSDKEGSGLLPAPDGVIQETSLAHKVAGQTVGRVLSFRKHEAREPAADLFKTLGTGRQSFTEATLSARVVPWILQEDRLVMPEAGAAILGLEAMPQDLSALVDLLHPEDVEAFLEGLERSRNVSFKARLRGAGGEWRWTRWCVDRGIDGYRGVVMDIGEQERLEERAKQACHRKGCRDMARHFVQRYQKNFQEGLDVLRALGRAHPEAAPAMDSLEQADRLLRALGEYALPESRPRVPIRLNAFLQEVILRASRMAGPGIEFHLEAGADLPEMLMAPGPMEDALVRIFENAIEAMGGTGAIHLATGLLYPRAHRSGSLPGPMATRVFIEVRDQGPGIPQAILAQVFDPFVTTHAYPGRGGLGLATVREIVEAHRGTVHAESIPGQGTRVRILIPL